MKRDLRRIFDKSFKVCCLVVTLIVGVISLLDVAGYQTSLFNICLFIGIPVVLVFIYFFIKDSSINDTIYDPELLDENSGFSISYDTKDDCRFLNQNTQRVFGSDFIDDAVAESWRRVNPKGFLCLKDSSKNIWAGLTLLSIEPKCFKFFKDGIIKESDIDYESLNSFEESFDFNDLYITLIIVIKAPPYVRKRHALPIMIWGFFEYLKKNYYSENGKKYTLYALPINQDSENLLINFGFTVYPNLQRKDKHRLYYLELTSENLERASSCARLF